MNKRTTVTLLLLILAIPILIIAGALIFKEKYYSWLSLSVAFISCVPLFYTFERKENSSTELTVLAVMIAISVMGRFVFAWIPGFKPVTALTVIVGIYLGKESGFAVGALSAVISNFYFGQGPWTPFQMFTWGLIGFVSGLLSKTLRKNKIILCVFGAITGMLYSMGMDIWTTVWAEGEFNSVRYLASVLTALPATVAYVISNIIFLLILSKPFGDKLTRIKTKYGLFVVNSDNKRGNS